tara:strand:+ start:27063 stop:28280 length:1218 start_codon:yes stop_codon:yes gene_type:complete
MAYDIAQESRALGNNNLGSQGCFLERKYYAERVYPTDGPKPIDFWYRTPLYGKINYDGEVIYLGGAKFLGTIAGERSSDEVLALRPVASAFKEFNEEYKALMALRGCSDAPEDDPLSSINPKRGWTDANNLYHQYMTGFFNTLGSVFLKENQREQSLVDFRGFVRLFAEAVHMTNGKMPITKTAFVKSNLCPHRTSGVVIDVGLGDFSDDLIKHTKYIKSPNFNTYRYMAKRHGFLVDKNAPWRLVADLASEPMKKHMAMNGTTPKTFFSDYYLKAHVYDIAELKARMFAWYNEYVLIYPTYIKATTTSGASKKCVVDRTPITMEKYNADFDANFWLRFYLYIRAKESIINMSQSQFEAKVRKAQKIYKYYQYERSVDYLDKEVRSFSERITGEGEATNGFRLYG